MNNKLIENMEVKLIKLRKELTDAKDKVNFLINDLHKLLGSEDSKSEGLGKDND